ncbi:thymidylate synthase [Listeria weihenstephanensis]|uniref:Thymidylate synthase n=1 Tax=Listeria weihenstephanensis TaxID=1006155 RepID=A0A1S7FW39_9LIST|nr:YdeI/OmpD-associated family protein [Listeria weihenstephanensis]AQY51610.1 thymidylate synthase [Listeria weihenstephanensis]
MEMNNLLSISDRGALRHWLQENSDFEKCCWVIVSIKEEPGKIMYLDAVEEALCFGWIDGVKKKISDTELAQRLSPRSKNSSWTELNKERVRRLEKLGLMTDSGRKILPNMAIESFELDSIIEQRLKDDIQVYEAFMAFPDLYKRVRIDTIQSNKKQIDLFERRLDKFIENTRMNKMYGTWHDNGRLLDY